MDNIFIKRLWRSLEYDALYPHESADGFTAWRLIADWITLSNAERPHVVPDGRAPVEGGMIRRRGLACSRYPDATSPWPELRR